MTLLPLLFSASSPLPSSLAACCVYLSLHLSPVSLQHSHCLSPLSSVFLLPVSVWLSPYLFWVPGSLFQPPLIPGVEGANFRELPTRLRGLPTDVNECWTSPGRLCQHTCENTLGSYRCSCASGFQLAADGKHCKGTADPTPFPSPPHFPPGEESLLRPLGKLCASP